MSSYEQSFDDKKSNQLLDPHLLSQIKDYQLLARIAANGFLSGHHRSLNSGQGSEFLQYRNYDKGEDLKFVDWKYYAKTDRLQTKRFTEHTQACCYLLIDASASMAYQGSRSPCSKFHYAKMIAATISWLAMHQGDKVGLIIYSDQILEWLPPASHSSQLRLILRTLQQSTASGIAQHDKIIKTLISQLNDRGMVILISDMTEAEDEIPKLFRFSATNKYEGLAMQISDPDEIDFPFTESLRFEDIETGKQIQANSASIRDHYLQQSNEVRERMQDSFSQVHVDLFRSITNQDISLSISKYFNLRKTVR